MMNRRVLFAAAVLASSFVLGCSLETGLVKVLGCEENEMRCDYINNESLICKDGLWVTADTCGDEFKCIYYNDGSSEKTMCTKCLSGSRSCNGNEMQICRNGKWEKLVVCDQKCINSDNNAYCSECSDEIELCYTMKDDTRPDKISYHLDKCISGKWIDITNVVECTADNKCLKKCETFGSKGYACDDSKGSVSYELCGDDGFACRYDEIEGWGCGECIDDKMQCASNVENDKTVQYVEMCVNGKWELLENCQGSCSINDSKAWCNICENGDQICDGGMIFECQDNNYELKGECKNHTCANDNECYISDDDETCSSDGFQCGKSGNRQQCVQGKWVDADCGSDESCSDGECIKKCNNGDRSCDEDGIPNVCKNGNWVPNAPCSDGKACLNGNCEETCSDDAKKCDGNAPSVCIDGFWKQQDECRNTEICLDGVCEEKICDENAVKCDDDNKSIRWKCSNNRWESIDCGTEEVCIDGNCISDPQIKCPEGESDCKICEQNSDCGEMDGIWICDDIINICRSVECIIDENCTDSTNGKVCDIKNHKCVECQTGEDCKTAEIGYACENNKCYECLKGEDCKNAGIGYACENNKCYECLKGDDCQNAQKGNVCKENICVECISSDDCQRFEKGNVCDNNKCYECLSDNDCKQPGLNICFEKNCVECKGDIDICENNVISTCVNNKLKERKTCTEKERCVVDDGRYECTDNYENASCDIPGESICLNGEISTCSNGKWEKGNCDSGICFNDSYCADKKYYDYCKNAVSTMNGNDEFICSVLKNNNIICRNSNEIAGLNCNGHMNCNDGVCSFIDECEKFCDKNICIDDKSCSKGEHCILGECKVCMDGDFKCGENDGNVYFECEDGDWIEKNCKDDTICDGFYKTCVEIDESDLCNTPGEHRCIVENNELQVCRYGKWFVTEKICAKNEICSEKDGCIPPLNSYCDAPEQCEKYGLICDKENNKCVECITENQKKCNDDYSKVLTCENNSWVSERECHEGQVCVFVDDGKQNVETSCKERKEVYKPKVFYCNESPDSIWKPEYGECDVPKYVCNDDYQLIEVEKAFLSDKISCVQGDGTPGYVVKMKDELVLVEPCPGNNPCEIKVVTEVENSYSLCKN